MPAFLIAALVALLGGGTSMAAENALPGDTLYGMKTQVNERVVAALSLGEDAKASWEARLAERRLEEAASVAAEGQLTPDVAARLKENFDAHAGRVEARVEALKSAGKADDAVDFASRFESSLRAHERILAGLKDRADADKDTEETDALEQVASATEQVLGKAENDRKDLEKSIQDEDGKPERQQPAEGKVRAAENVLAEVKRVIESRKDRVTAASLAQANDAVKAAEATLAEAKAKLAGGTYGDAFVLANQAIRTAQEAKQVLEHNEDLRLDVKTHEEIRSERSQESVREQDEDKQEDQEDDKTEDNRVEVRIRR